MPLSTPNLEFFLGGRDLEMATIEQLLNAKQQTVHTKGLGWGATASAYKHEIEQCLTAGHRPVFVELPNDLSLDDQVFECIDHHNNRAGADQPSSLEQLFKLMDCPQSEWTRWHELVAANDKGHVHGMRAVQATPEEMRRVRAEDRSAQGITPSEEETGRQAANAAELLLDGKLTVVHLPHARTATVTDVLDRDLGGPGYENLWIVSPEQTSFFGSGSIIKALHQRFPESWYGGNLPERGFWGIAQAVDLDAIMGVIK